MVNMEKKGNFLKYISLNYNKSSLDIDKYKKSSLLNLIYGRYSLVRFSQKAIDQVNRLYDIYWNKQLHFMYEQYYVDKEKLKYIYDSIHSLNIKDKDIVLMKFIHIRNDEAERQCPFLFNLENCLYIKGINDKELFFHLYCYEYQRNFGNLHIKVVIDILLKQFQVTTSMKDMLDNNNQGQDNYNLYTRKQERTMAILP